MNTSKETQNYRPTFRIQNAARSRRNLLLSALCSLALILASCGSDNPTDPGGNGGNGNGNGNGEIPPEPTYANVQEIFNSSCGGSGCHLSSATSGVQLNNYDNIINSVGSQYGEKVVKPEDAAGSPLVDKIESSSPQHGQSMPPNGSLSSEQIKLIKDWINDGANESSDNNDSGSNGGY